MKLLLIILFLMGSLNTDLLMKTNEFSTTFIVVITEAKFDSTHFLQANKFRKVTIRLPILS